MDDPEEQMEPHVVRQGEHLARLAAERGVESARVWDDPSNAELRGRRGSGQILAPGDVVTLPRSDRAGGVSLSARSDNAYRGRLELVTVKLRLCDGPRRMANELCRIEGVGAFERSTDADGELSLTVPARTEELRVTVLSTGVTRTFRVGHLDPIDGASGVEHRLENLGYLLGRHDDGSIGDRARRVAAALLAFQRDRGLEPTGTTDEATRDALASAHGH